MKKIFYIGILFLCLGCLNNDFLDKFPKDKLTEETLFTTNDNFRIYSISFYEEFPAYKATKNLYGADFEADNYFRGTKGSESDWAWQKVKVPAENGGWNFWFIRKINILLQNIDRPNELTDIEKEHWRSVGYFFRAYKYLDLITKFGDVIWIDKVLDENSPELFAPRTSRDVVAENMLRDLKYAEEHIIKESENLVDQDVVRALISRFTLFEGTWRKYHGLKDAEKYLEECVRVSKLLVEKHPILHANYDEVFNSLDLTGVSSIFLFRDYAKNVVMHTISRAHMANKLSYEVTKDAIDAYLCQNGRPIYAQDNFPKVEQDPFTEFQDRDLRLLYSVLPPYRVATGTASYEKEWWHTDDPKDQTFFPIMSDISKKGFKELPIRQDGGSVCKFSPHFILHNGGFNFQATQGGYYPYKFMNHHEPYPVKGNTSCAPIFRLGEVMLNYAEAAYELDELDQETIDKTINKLRERGRIAELNMNSIAEDCRRDADVSPLLWEIRRERRVELMGEGFRFNDIRRWKKGEYVNKRKLGRWYSAQHLIDAGLIKSAGQCKIKFLGGGKEGYITFYGDPVEEGLGWKEHYYLYPLPLQDLALNKELEQNPGW